LRRKFLRHHLQLAVKLRKLPSVLELAQWTLSGKSPSPSATTEWMGDQLVQAAIRILSAQLQTTPPTETIDRSSFESLKVAYDLHSLGRRRLVGQRILELERLIGTLYVVSGYANIEDDPPDISAVLMNCSELWPAAKVIAGAKRPRAQSASVPPPVPTSETIITTSEPSVTATEVNDDTAEPSEKEPRTDVATQPKHVDIE
jgi:hypothetical protein